MSERKSNFRKNTEPQPKKDNNHGRHWTAPSYEERQAAKNQPAQEASRPMTVDEELHLATMDSHLEHVDLHGKRRDEALAAANELIAENPDSCVRIIYGRGTGVLEDAVWGLLEQESRSKKSRIAGMKKDPHTFSVVVRVK